MPDPISPRFPSSLIAHQRNFEDGLGIGFRATPIWIGEKSDSVSDGFKTDRPSVTQYHWQPWCSKLTTEARPAAWRGSNSEVALRSGVLFGLESCEVRRNRERMFGCRLPLDGSSFASLPPECRSHPRQGRVRRSQRESTRSQRFDFILTDRYNRQP
jgi:hypothetical protein